MRALRTPGDGLALLPFHGNLLQAAISTDVPVQGVALRYSQPGLSPSTAALWVGDTTLLASLWAVACASELTVHLVVLPPHGTAHADRRALAHHMRDQIEAALRPQGRSPLHSP